jgi:hypothetical protein
MPKRCEMVVIGAGPAGDEQEIQKHFRTCPRLNATPSWPGWEDFLIVSSDSEDVESAVV